MRLLYQVKSEYSCDSDRIYVSGLSMGGYATWSVLERYGEVFAAGVPICGWGNPQAAARLSKIPIWIYHGSADPTVSYKSSEEMYFAIKHAGGNMIHFNTLYGVGHNAWDYALKDRNLFCWLFAQSKSKSQSGNDSYTYIPLLSVVSPVDETVFTDEDIEFSALFYKDDKPYLTVYLSESAAERLKNACENHKNQDFTVYCCGSKSYTFKPLKAREDNKFDLADCIPSEIMTSLMFK